MVRARDPARDEAYNMWKEAGGNITNREIANTLGVDEKKIATWKSRDKWNGEKNVVQQKKKRSTSKKKKCSTTKTEVPQKVVEKAKELVEDNTSGLTEKQKLFCYYYIQSFNGTSAAIKAGYAKEGAGVEAHRLLRNAKVKNELKRLKEELSQELLIDTNRILNRHAQIASSDIRDFVKFGVREEAVTKNGIPLMIENEETGTPEPLMQRKNYVDFNNYEEVDGTLIKEVSIGKDGAKIKLESRDKSLAFLSNFLTKDPHTRLMDEEKLKLAREKLELEKKKAKLDGEEKKDIKIEIVGV